jgi:ABC-2 type transport system ATP-binding protein
LSAGPEPIARLEGVRMEFQASDQESGRVVALDGVDLELQPGRVAGLLGRNGAGKTTAVRILTGLQEPSAGRATIAGFDVREQDLEAKRRLGYVPDGAPLYAQLSPREHLALVGELFGIAPDETRERAERLLAGFDLDGRGDSPVGGFSRGMRQKTALACALLPEPRLLVLDEPLAGLDAPTAMTVKEVLREWARRGGAVLVTSHLLDVVERLCDEVALLDGGRLKARGSLDDLRAQSGEDGTLEQVFRALTDAEDPLERAQRLLGESAPR